MFLTAVSFISHTKRLVALAVLCTLFILPSKAQQPDDNQGGKITGRVVDSLLASAVEYASISLVNQSDDKVVNGTTTDDKGNFKLTGVADGTYKLQIFFIGYQTAVKSNIVVDKTKASVSLGNIKLQNKQTNLKEVTVTAEKSLIENKIDKMVYNADKDLTSQGGVATDLLRKIPQVNVDVDGNVELQGNSNIQFLINGKPSVIFGNNIADVLQAIPASQIQSIEVITSPGAKYDAEGTGGIINIILKKATAEGVNGSISLSGGTRLENTSINLNAHKGTFGAHAFFSGNALLQSTTLNSMNRVTPDTVPQQSKQLLQNGPSDFTRDGYQSGIGFDWQMTSMDDITGSLGYNYFATNNNGTVNRQTITQDASQNVLSNVTDNIVTSNYFHSHTMDWNLSYKRSFKNPDQKLELSYNNSNATNMTYYDQTQEHLVNDALFSGSYGNNPGTQNETDITADYTQPLKGGDEIETGVKAQQAEVISTSDVYLLNPVADDYNFNNTQSSALDYKRNVYAGYVSGTFKILNWLDVKAGFRTEYTQLNATFSNSGNVDLQPYYTYSPSLIVSRSLKNNQTIKIGYSHRIQRPDYRDLNPFINAADPKNITTGNPNLLPEVGDKIELTYNKVYSKGASINAVLFYRGQRNDLQTYVTYYPTYVIGDSTYTDVAVTKRENIGREDNYGVNLYGSLPVASKLQLRTNLSGFERYITTGLSDGGDVHGFNYRINLNVTYEVDSTLTIEAFGNFNSPRTNAQGTVPSFTTYNLALRKQLFHKKGSIAATATNPFNQYINQQTELAGTNFTLSNLRQLPFRSFGINFTYKFGHLKFKKEKKPDDNSPDDQGD
jgi:ferric enterobactin receptor